MWPAVAQRLSRRATSRTVSGSITGVVTGFFSDIFPSDRTMALGSTQPLTEMSTRVLPGGKDGRSVKLTTSPPSCAECHEIWEPKPPGNLWATPGLLRDFIFYCFFLITVLQYKMQLNFADDRAAKERHGGWSGEKLINMHGISGSTAQVGLYCALQDAPGYETFRASMT